jgi:hypothetical protein
MRLHEVTRALAIAGMLGIGVRWSQLRLGHGGPGPGWIAVIPEWLTLLFVLAALLIAPVLALTEIGDSRPGRSFYIDAALIATTYLCFLCYIRFA